MILKCNKKGCDFQTKSAPAKVADRALKTHITRKHTGTSTPTTDGQRAQYSVSKPNGRGKLAEATPPTLDELLTTKRFLTSIGGLDRLEICVAYLKKLA